MKEKILVIDDMELIVTLFKIILSRQGYDVSACGYYDAMEKIALTDFEVVLTDIELGEDKTGIDVLKEIRRKDLTCPVILCTGAPDIMDESEAKLMGAYDYLSKPVGPEILLHSVRMALRNKTKTNGQMVSHLAT